MFDLSRQGLRSLGAICVVAAINAVVVVPLVAWPAVAQAGAAPGPAMPTMACDLTGQWRTTFGLLSLIQDRPLAARGAPSQGESIVPTSQAEGEVAVAGTYRASGGSGYLRGQVQGDKLTFRWYRPSMYTPPGDAGDGYFEIVPDCEKLTGQFRSGYEGPFSGTWNGARIEAPLARPLVDVPLWSGRPVGGEVAFRVPSEAAGGPLVLEIAATNPVLRFQLEPPMASTTAVAAAPSPAPAASPTPAPVPAPAPQAAPSPVPLTAAAAAPAARPTATPPSAAPPVSFIAVNKPGEEVNVALARHRTRVDQQMYYGDKLIDGDASEAAGMANQSLGRPMDIRLAAPYTIHRVRFLLATDQTSFYHYRLEGSPDGQNWHVLADRSTGEHRGWQEIALPQERLLYFRLTGLETSFKAVSGSLAVKELQVYTRDPVPDLSRNLVAAGVGGAAISATSEGSGSTSYDASRLLDGNPDGVPWISEEKEPLPPQEIVFQFFEQRSAPIHAVIVHPGSYAAGGWNDPRNRPKRVELRVSTTSPTDGFRSVGSFELTRDLGAQLLTFAPVEAKFVKLRLTENFGGKFYSLGEVQIFEAVGEDRRSILDEFMARRLGDSQTSDPNNLFHYLAGGRLVSYEAGGNMLRGPEQLKKIGLLLNDGSTDRLLSGSVQPVKNIATFVLAFFGRREALIEGVNVYAYEFTYPFKLDLFASRAGPEGPYERVANTRLVPTGWEWFGVDFAPTRARFLKLVVTPDERENGGLTEFQVNEARVSGYTSILVQPPYPDFRAGANIALAALGGSAAATSDDRSHDGWSAATLIDGQTSDGYGTWVSTYGWSSHEAPSTPVELTFAFRDKRLARIVGLAVNPMVMLKQSGGMDSRWTGDVMSRVHEFEVWISRDGTESDWQRVGEVYYLRNSGVQQLFPFASTIEARYIKLRLLTNYRGKRFQLGEVEIYEALEEEGYASILSDVAVNIADPTLGGGLVRFTSQSNARERAAGNLVKPLPSSKGWSSADASLPQRLLFAFKDFRMALVDRIVVHPQASDTPKGWAKKLKVAASVTDSPLRDYATVGIFDLAQQGEPQSITFPSPVKARFLELAILENHGHPYTYLGSVAVIEAHRPGYVSVLATFPGKVRAGDAETSAADGARVAARQATAVEEEPNDTSAMATRLSLGTVVAGHIEPPTDVDYFALDLTASVADVLSVELTGDPYIKTSVRLEDEQGKVVAEVDPPAAAMATFTLHTPAGQYFLRLWEPPTSVVLIFDNSGSMSDSIEALKKAALRYIADKAPHEEMALLKFADTVESLSDFTSDQKTLEAAVADKMKAAGGTAIYDALRKALALVKERKGNRAIVLFTDGGDTTSKLAYPAAWEALAEAGVRLYTIGLGAELEAYLPTIGTTGSRMLEAWSRATGGRFFFAPDASALLGVYGEIARELRGATAYTVAAHVPKGKGMLRVLETGEKLSGVAVPGQIELIFDASGSMKRKIGGRMMIAIAKDAMAQIIESLPNDVEVALRVYGHRIRERQRGDCQDSELVFPFARIDKPRLLERVRAIHALGTTPIAYSLQQVERDFGGAPGEKMVILVTDGEEECGGSPSAVVSELLAKGFKVRLNIVGFALVKEATKQEMERVAQLTGGHFFDAKDGKALQGAVQQALAVPYDVLDASGTHVGGGLTGQGVITLPEGMYTTVVHAMGEPIIIPGVRINQNQLTKVELKKEGQEIKTRVLEPVSQ